MSDNEVWLQDLWNRIPSFVTSPDPHIYSNGSYVVLDFETTNLNKGDPYNPDNKLLLAVWRLVHPGDPGKLKYCWGSEYEMGELLRDIQFCDFIVAHNAQFELAWLARCGYDVGSKPIFCTQVAEYVIAGNRKWKLSLEDCANRAGWDGKLSIISKLIKQGVCPSEIPQSWLLDYCIKDVELCERLFRRQLGNLDRLGLLRVHYSRCLFTPVLADIGKNGMHLDAERVERLYNVYRTRLDILEAEFDELSGGINVKSPKQLIDFIYGELGFDVPKDYRGNPILTKSGQPSTSADSLAKLKPKNKKQRQFIDLKKAISKTKDALSKYLNSFQRCINEREDNILMASHNQTRTGTHRLSSSGKEYSVQMQNIPRDFKPLFSARNEGWSIGEHDEGQLEFRAAVDLARDEQGANDISENVDVHAFTATILYGNDFVEGEKARQKQLRTMAKAHTFKPLYGGSSGTPREREYYSAFKKKYPAVTRLQESWKSTVLRDKQLRIPSGLIFYWPDTKMTHSGYIVNTTNICNYPVQSIATADLLPLAMICFWHRLRAAKLQSFLVNTIHDSVIGEVHPDEKEKYDAIGQKALTDDAIYMFKALYDYEWITPLEADGEFSLNWADSEHWRETYLGD